MISWNKIRTAFTLPAAACLALLTVACDSVAQDKPFADVVKAQIIADKTAVKPGDKVTVGVLFDIQPKWYIYWKNPGESGYETSVKWTLPSGLKAGEVKYPAPTLFVSPGDLMSYGYKGKTLLFSEVEVGQVTGSEVEIKADGKWLMCSDRCVPGKDSLSMKLPVGDGQPANQEIFDKFRKTTPNPGKPTDMKISKAQVDGKTQVSVALTPPAGGGIVAEHRGEEYRSAYFFPYKQEDAIVVTAKAPEPDGDVGGVKAYTKPTTLTYTIEPLGDKKDFPVEGVLVRQTVSPDNKSQLQVVEIRQP